MGRTCQKCGRGALKGYSRSHSNIASLRHQQLNLQWKRIAGKRIKICANCIKNLSREKALA